MSCLVSSTFSLLFSFMEILISQILHRNRLHTRESFCASCMDSKITWQSSEKRPNRKS
ncbi:BnaA01g25620D [Brassica napus]|uniref:BnaA01g25620D protein n=1 Tax=Brassica napus TaxID=3708 RepID=A0A078HZN0_BRANA|nr:BnaA01g25620D [Brassica napus]